MLLLVEILKKMAFFQNQILPGIVTHVCNCRPITRQIEEKKLVKHTDTVVEMPDRRMLSKPQYIGAYPEMWIFHSGYENYVSTRLAAFNL
jgi:hypothetical protein